MIMIHDEIQSGGTLARETRFKTITGADWRHSLQAARKRRKAAADRIMAAVRAGRGGRMECPLCGRLAALDVEGNGAVLKHAGGVTCSLPLGEGVTS